LLTVSESYQAAALIVVGHGTTLNAESSAPVYQHCAELRRRKLFAEVREAFWKQEPALGRVISQVTAERVFIAPFFISEGYFCEAVIPRALGFLGEKPAEFTRVRQNGHQRLAYCKPVGTHQSMTAVLLARARQVTEIPSFTRPPQPKETTLFIAGHGTSQNENSRQAIERQVELIQPLGHYAAVHAVFLEEEPRVPECYRLAHTRNLVVVPFFISDGLHAQEDIPLLLGEPPEAIKERLRNGQPSWPSPTEKNGKLVWYAPAVGTHPLMSEVLLQRVREAAAWG
jgi:sirohydrochlorin cobaltochelatase